jgi:calcium/calmodulin-dependent protein kinase I
MSSFLQWLTTHEPSTEHDLAVGLREHFDPRARWRSAISSARAIHRLGSGSRSSTASKQSSASGGWADSDEEDDEKGDSGRKGHDPGSNEYVNVVVPDEVGLRVCSPGEMGADTKQETLKQTRPRDLNEDEATGKSRADSKEEEVESPTQVHDEPESMIQSDDEDLNMRIPGSFDLIGPQEVQGQGATWGDMLRRLTIT